MNTVLSVRRDVGQTVVVRDGARRIEITLIWVDSANKSASLAIYAPETATIIRKEIESRPKGSERLG